MSLNATPLFHRRLADAVTLLTLLLKILNFELDVDYQVRFDARRLRQALACQTPERQAK